MVTLNWIKQRLNVLVIGPTGASFDMEFRLFSAVALGRELNLTQKLCPEARDIESLDQALHLQSLFV